MISKTDALAALVDHLAKSYPQYGPRGVAINDDAIECEYGWFFTYTTAEFRRTRDPGYVLIGAGPVLVLREDGRIVEFSSAFSKEFAVAMYEDHPEIFHSPG